MHLPSFMRRWSGPMVLALFGATVSAEIPPSQPRPNILWIMADQFRYDCVGANGNKFIKTPSLDQLANESANFSHAFVQSPVCVPSRASFFTGRYPHSHRNRVNYTPLKPDEILLPARLHSVGYQTALIGKLHLYYQYPPTQDEARKTGFDFVDLHDGIMMTDKWSDYATWRKERDPNWHTPPHTLARGRKDNPPADENPYLAAIDAKFTETTWTGLRTCDRLKELAGKDRPFFMFCSFWKPHSPYDVPRPFDSLYNDVQIPLPQSETLATINQLPLPVQKLILRNRRGEYEMSRSQLEWMYRSYYGTVSQVDQQIGLIFAQLRELGVADNTIIVFTSDHGDQLLEHGLTGKNLFFEASERVPLFIRFPKKVRPARYDELTESVDVLPTLFDLLGLPEPGDCQGQSLAGLISDPAKKFTPREAVFAENIIPEVITSEGQDFMYEKGKGVKGVRYPDAKMVRTSRWKYNYYPDGYAELFDLQKDPGEYQNVAADPANHATLNEMKDRLIKWLVTADESDQIAPKWLIP